MVAEVVRYETVTYYGRCEQCMSAGMWGQTRDLQFSSRTRDGAERMVADHNERWHREEAGE